MGGGDDVSRVGLDSHGPRVVIRWKNESSGSDASLSQTRNQLSKTLAAVNASIKKA